MVFTLLRRKGKSEKTMLRKYNKKQAYDTGSVMNPNDGNVASLESLNERKLKK